MKKLKKLQSLELICSDCTYNFARLVWRFYEHFRDWKFTESATVDGAKILRVDIPGKENTVMELFDIREFVTGAN